MHPCERIAELWQRLNPHTTVEGCISDATGKVTIFVWYWRFNGAKNERELIPLALVLGRPPSAVIRALENATRLIFGNQPAQD